MGSVVGRHPHAAGTQLPERPVHQQHWRRATRRHGAHARAHRPSRSPRRTSRSPSRATPPGSRGSGAEFRGRVERATAHGGDRRHRRPCARSRRHGLEQLPGDPVERGDAKTSVASNAVRIEAARSAGRANAETQVSGGVHPVGRRPRPTTTRSSRGSTWRFRDEFRPPSRRGWRSPLENPDAPPTPFAMEEYRLASADGRRPGCRGRVNVGRGPAQRPSAPANTCSASCCSLSPFSSPG